VEMISDYSPSRNTAVALAAFLGVALISFFVYYLTAFRTIPWWVASYMLAAADLGVAPPPGALLPTIVGWLVSGPAGPSTTAFALNLLAAGVAAVTAALVGIVAAGLIRSLGGAMASSFGGGLLSPTVWAGAMIGALTMAFADTLWEYAVQFTPYIFTALFTVLILWAMIRWWNRADFPGSWRWLILITLLFGLDFSVHRTNLLLLPGVVVWILLRQPRAFLSIKTWLSCGAGLLLGLSFHLLLIPIAAAKPFFNFGAASNWPGFWDYVTLQQFGGGWLVDLWPRKGPFLDYQVMDYLRAFAANFFRPDGSWSLVGILPTIFGFIGLVGLWRHSRRLAFGFIVLFLFSSLGAVIYFNVPVDFFRSMFRHYLPSFVIFAIWMSYGLAIFLAGLLKVSPQRKWLTISLTCLLVFALPVHQIAQNYTERDASNNYFAYDFSRNLLMPLAENAVLFTYGDNDTFGLWYLQAVEGIRPDVTVLNVHLLNTTWFIRQINEREPGLTANMTPAEIEELRPMPWKDTTITFAVKGNPSDFDMPAGTVLPDSISYYVKPTLSGQYLLPGEWMMLRIILQNNWRRPIYFANTGGDRFPEYVKPYIRPEGLVSCLVPSPDAPSDISIMRRNLLERYSYRGYADASVLVDVESKTMGINYLAPCLMLAYSAYQSGNQEEASHIMAHIQKVLPPDRLRPLPSNLDAVIRQLTGK
jgi:Protein O-mannosyl-transferase TMEM260-like